MTIDPTGPDLLQSKRFKMHASYMIEMLDSALNLLGPDIALLTEIITELGAKHERYGVRPEMFRVMGEALMDMLEKVLGPEEFTAATREAWKEIYAELSNDMINSYKSR